jgi:hypothetical protein
VVKPGGECVDLDGELAVPVSQSFQRQQDIGGHRIQCATTPGEGHGQPVAVQPTVSGPDRVGCPGGVVFVGRWTTRIGGASMCSVPRLAHGFRRSGIGLADAVGG